jgi:hypothetical protein
MNGFLYKSVPAEFLQTGLLPERKGLPTVKRWEMQAMVPKGLLKHQGTARVTRCQP